MTVRAMRKLAQVCLLTVCVASCVAPKPILYPNEHYKVGGMKRLNRRSTTAARWPRMSARTPSQGKTGRVAGNTAGGGAVGSAAVAVGDAVVGHPGRGAMVGAASGATAGFLRGLFRRSAPSQAYKQFVQRCLTERGYEPVGWE